MEIAVTSEPTGPDAPAEPVNASPAGASSERPSWLPEGMNSPEELAAAYTKLSQQKPPAETETETDAAPEVKADASASKFVQDAGLDPVALSREIAANGDINAQAKAALVKKLEKAGLPAAMVDEYISGQRYAAQAVVNDIYSVADGQAGFQKMSEWAGENLDPAELQTINNILVSGDVATTKLTVKNLYARYKREASIPGRRVRGGTRGSNGDVFQSLEQMVAAQADPRYSDDPAYREEIEGRIERSIKSGSLVTRTR